MDPTSNPASARPSGKKTIDRLPSLMTVDEAAAFFRINRNTLYEAIKKGEVPGVLRFGKRIRLSREAVKKWLEGKTHG